MRNTGKGAIICGKDSGLLSVGARVTPSLACLIACSHPNYQPLFLVLSRLYMYCTQ